MITEMVVDKLPRRCPYCDGVLPDREVSDVDEEKETCPHCGRVFIRARVSWDSTKGVETEKL